MSFLLFIYAFLWGEYVFFFLLMSVLLLLLSLPQTLGSAEGRRSIFTISWKYSRSVITLSQAIKLLPWSNQWQMLEGLFIFCLLIRVARRDAGTEREHGVRVIYRRKGETKKGTPCSSWRSNFYLYFGAQAVRRLSICQNSFEQPDTSDVEISD